MLRSFFYPAPLRRLAVGSGSHVHTVGLNSDNRPAITQRLPLRQALPFATGIEHDTRSLLSKAHHPTVMPERYLRTATAIFRRQEGIAHPQ